MSRENTLSRRGFLGAMTALGSISLAACATDSKQTSRVMGGGSYGGTTPAPWRVRRAQRLCRDHGSSIG